MSRQSLRTGMSPSLPLLGVLGFKFNIYHKELWAEQFLRIELQPKWKETSGKYSGKDWTRMTRKSLTKCSLIRDCTTLGVAMPVGLN